ncbi:MAG: trypsin-like serine protease, partial [Silanimonas sp.]
MRFLALTLLVAASTAQAIVIRDDVADREHRLAAGAFPALADLPGEAHGVLVAPRWVVTAAHAVGGQPSLDVIVVGGTPRAVRRVVVHPGFRSPPSAMV